MKPTRNIPFKNKTKYVLERKIDGDRAFIYGVDDKVEITPDEVAERFDERVISKIEDKGFVLEGRATDRIFYVTDLLVYDGENLEDEKWPERYKKLREFDWNNSIKLSKPLVVTNRQEMDDAVDIFTQIPNSEGVVIREYDSKIDDKKYFIPEEEFE